MGKTRPETRNEPSPHGSEMHLRIDTRKKIRKKKVFQGGFREGGVGGRFQWMLDSSLLGPRIDFFHEHHLNPPVPSVFYQKIPYIGKGGCGKEVRKNTVTFSLMVPLTEAAQQKKTATLLFGLRNRKSIKVLRVVVFFFYLFVFVLSLSSLLYFYYRGFFYLVCLSWIGRKVPAFFGHLGVV